MQVLVISDTHLQNELFQKLIKHILRWIIIYIVEIHP